MAEDGSPAAPIGGTILIPLWPGFGLGHAPRGPGAAGKESHHPGPAPPRLALDDPFKMPPSAGFSRIAVEMELVSHDDHPNGRDRRQGAVGSWPEKHIATAIVTDAAPDDRLYSAKTHAARLSKRQWWCRPPSRAVATTRCLASGVRPDDFSTRSDMASSALSTAGATKNAVAIVDEEAIEPIDRKAIPELLDGPLSRVVSGEVPTNDLPGRYV